MPCRLQIGTQLTGGLGAGACPKKGEDAAKENRNEVLEVLKDGTRMLFITAGMGGGTGTGAAPVIAQMANEMDILTVGIVTLPFHWEGPNKMKQAVEGVEKMKTYCDTVLVVLNEKLKEMYRDISVRNAFAKANDVLNIAAKGIAEIITVPGEVNVDFEDVKTVMYRAGDAVMGSAVANGPDRALQAIESASSSPLLNNQHLHGAKKILLSIVCGNNPEMGMEELDTITDYVQGKIGEDAELIFGHGFSTDLDDQIAVTLIATGFESRPNLESTRQKARTVYDLDAPMPAPSADAASSLSASSELLPLREDPQALLSDDDTDHSIKVNDSGIENEVSIDVEAQNTPSAEIPLEELQGTAHPLKRQHTLVAEREERVRTLAGVKDPNNFDTGAVKDKLEKPAYLRRNVQLPDIPPSVQRNLSRFYLDAEDKLLGKNRFLYDNVD